MNPSRAPLRRPPASAGWQPSPTGGETAGVSGIASRAGTGSRRGRPRGRSNRARRRRLPEPKLLILSGGLGLNIQALVGCTNLYLDASCPRTRTPGADHGGDVAARGAGLGGACRCQAHSPRPGCPAVARWPLALCAAGSSSPPPARHPGNAPGMPNRCQAAGVSGTMLLCRG